MDKILEEIKKERWRQNAKFGEQNHNPVEWIAILSEEVGEASKEAVDFHFQYGLDGLRKEKRFSIMAGIQQDRIQRLRKELIQVAAVAVSILESIDRNEANF